MVIQGGAIAAPVAGQILSEVLPYMEVKKTEIEEPEKIETPNIIGMTIRDAKKFLKDMEIELKIKDEPEGINEAETVIKEQIPSQGIVIEKNSYILCGI